MSLSVFGAKPEGFVEGEYQQFQFKFLIFLMLAGGVLTGLLVAGSFSGLNPIDGPHLYTMIFFTLTTICVMLLIFCLVSADLAMFWGESVEKSLQLFYMIRIVILRVGWLKKYVNKLKNVLFC